MTWDEIDLDNQVWAIAAERTKTASPHRVPLSSRTLEVLAEAIEPELRAYGLAEDE